MPHETPKPLYWSIGFAWSLSAVIVSGCAWGWIDRAGLWGGVTRENFMGCVLTALGAATQLGANLLAIHARKAHKADGSVWSLDFGVSMGAMICCGLYTHASLENAWQISQHRFPGLAEATAVGALVPVMLWAAPWLEPYLYWRIEKQRDIDLSAIRAHEAEEDQRIASEAQVRRMDAAAKEMARELTKGAERPFTTQYEALQRDPPTQMVTPRKAADRKRPQRWPPEKRAEVIELAKARVSFRKIETQTGVPHETARRMFMEHEQEKAA